MTSLAETETWTNAISSDTAPASILVVDDDPIAAEELSETLETEGFRCIATHTADDAIAVLTEHADINVVITDFYLRGVATARGNGLDLIERIRETFQTRDFDFIVVSGDRDVLVDCTVTEAFKFLAKPIMPESICSMVKTSSAPQSGPTEADSTASPQATYHRMIEAQASAIAGLTDALKEARKDKREVVSRMDRLVSAASIAGRRHDDAGARDVAELLRYIVGQGYAVKKLMHGEEASETGASKVTRITRIAP